MGPLDQRVNQQRPDVLVYSTAPLTEDTEVSGIVEAQLVFSTDVTDTDFFVTLSDVYPDGKAIDITEGQTRARFRESLEHPLAADAEQGVHDRRSSSGERATCSRKGIASASTSRAATFRDTLAI